MRGAGHRRGGEETARAATSASRQSATGSRMRCAGLEPVRAGRFLVHGAHDRARVGANDIAIEIEAALAFGTGHHGTTRGCLLASRPRCCAAASAAILDVGCGTGVLAIAAAKALRQKVSLGDIDPIAVEVANGKRPAERRRRICRARSVSRGVEARAELRQGAPFDLVFANILAKPLRALWRRPCAR